MKKNSHDWTCFHWFWFWMLKGLQKANEKGCLTWTWFKTTGHDYKIRKPQAKLQIEKVFFPTRIYCQLKQLILCWLTPLSKSWINIRPGIWLRIRRISKWNCVWNKMELNLQGLWKRCAKESNQQRMNNWTEFSFIHMWEKVLLNCTKC